MFSKFPFFSKISVSANNRSVVALRDINAPVLTGDIHAEINIDQKSFSQATFLAQASAFDSCNNKIPLLWATLQCLELLSPDRELREKLKLKFVQDKVSLSVVVLNEEAKNIRLLYSKATSGEIDKKDLKTIISNIYKDIKPGFTVQIICNKVISKPVKEFYEKAITDEFNTKYFNKERLCSR
jgi:hypothetical protein